LRADCQLYEDFTLDEATAKPLPCGGTVLLGRQDGVSRCHTPIRAFRSARVETTRSSTVASCRHWTRALACPILATAMLCTRCTAPHVHVPSLQRWSALSPQDGVTARADLIGWADAFEEDELHFQRVPDSSHHIFAEKPELIAATLEKLVGGPERQLRAVNLSVAQQFKLDLA